MVAKINRGSKLYGAVIYNQEKVKTSTARIISGNRILTDLGSETGDDLQRVMKSLKIILQQTNELKNPYCIFPSIHL